MSIEIILAPELGQFVQDKVRSGEFSDPSDVIGSALAMLKEQESLEHEDTDELREQIAVGIGELEHGNSASWDVSEMKAALDAQLTGKHL